jgi:hypothetical protein
MNVPDLKDPLTVFELQDIMTYCPVCLTKSVLGWRCLNKYHEQTLTARASLIKHDA